MPHNPFQAVRDCEAAVAAYCGSKYAVLTTSCTDAILVACSYLGVNEVELPCRTFVGVAQSVITAGGTVKFRDYEWSGGYQLAPYPIFDMARRFRKGMHSPGTFTCVSFHVQKICGHTDGGAILCNSEEDNDVLHRMCYDGRPLEGNKDVPIIRGFHAYCAPSTAAGIHRRLATLPDHNDDLPNSDYPDLSKMEIFR